jgi:hypothetical protein
LPGGHDLYLVFQRQLHITLSLILHSQIITVYLGGVTVIVTVKMIHVHQAKFMQENAMMELDVVILGDKYIMDKVSCFLSLFSSFDP